MKKVTKDIVNKKEKHVSFSVETEDNERQSENKLKEEIDIVILRRRNAKLARRRRINVCLARVCCCVRDL